MTTPQPCAGGCTCHPRFVGAQMNCPLHGHAEPTQPTLEALRALMPVVGGKRRGLYAGTPGTGPAGETCASCRHKRYSGGRKLHPKCGLTNYTHGDATTIRTSTPACAKWEPMDG